MRWPVKVSVNAPRVNPLPYLVKGRFALVSFCYSPVSDPRSCCPENAEFPMHARWPRLDGLAYGGDHHPGQSPDEGWAGDVALTRPAEHEFGCHVCVPVQQPEARLEVLIGAPTAAPPPWFLHRHPEAPPVTR